jgi:hypothetical protein
VSESTWASIDLLERAQQRTLDGGPVIDVVGTADSHAATHTRAHSYRRGARYSAVRTAKPDLCSGAVASRGLMRRRLSRARSSCVAINASSAQAENTTAVTGGRPPNVDTRGGSKTRLDDVAAFGQRRHTEAHQPLRRREYMHPTGLPARLLVRGVEPPREFSQPVRQLSPAACCLHVTGINNWPPRPVQSLSAQRHLHSAPRVERSDTAGQVVPSPLRWRAINRRPQSPVFGTRCAGCNCPSTPHQLCSL